MEQKKKTITPCEIDPNNPESILIIEEPVTTPVSFIIKYISFSDTYNYVEEARNRQKRHTLYQEYMNNLSKKA